MTDLDTTPQKIARAALSLMLRQGIKKTSLEEVAHQAGVTRVTVYRHFPNKRVLVEAALMTIPVMLEELQADMEQYGDQPIEKYLDQLIAGFRTIAEGDAPALLEETRRVYPETWQVFQHRRMAALGGIFGLFLGRAEAQGLLRSGLQRPVVEAYFTTMVTRVVEDPGLVSLGLSANDIFQTVKTIFLYGILQEQPQ